MMLEVSIKTILPELERSFGMDGSKIYERQRALVDARLLKSRPGRGPGSGVAVEPRSISLVLLALMAADQPKAGAQIAGELARFVPISKDLKPVRCAWTRETNLLDAMNKLIVKGQLHHITLAIQNNATAALEAGDGEKITHSQVFSPRGKTQMPLIDVRKSFELRHLVYLCQGMKS